jgi:ribokinase
VDFAIVPRLPRPGEILHTAHFWEEAAGGGAVAAVQMAKLTGAAVFVTALARDDLGRETVEQLAGQGVTVHAAARDGRQRRGFVYLTDDGERTITVLGAKLRPRGDDELPWDALEGADAVYFASGDAAALRRARRARVLVATARELATLKAADVLLDALVGSGEDEHERHVPGELEPPPALVVSTSGALGGWAQPGGPYTAAPPAGPVEDAYGCGDCFAAGLTYALARGLETADALAYAARCGAGALAGRGVHAATVEL